MSILDSPKILLKAASQLGLPSLGSYACYRAGLRTGYFRWITTRKKIAKQKGSASWAINSSLLTLPTPESLQSVGDAYSTRVLAIADEIAAGQVRLFDGPAVDLNLVPPEPLAHWTDYETGKAKLVTADIKWVWEPARFGWAINLAQAYLVSKNERYAQAFWRYTELFLESNPPYQGSNWLSAQEVALRLIALVFSIQIFIKSPHTTPDRLQYLSQAIAEHASRIPPTLIYARAQNNNHLLCEAAGLITASLALPEHPRATRWRDLGRRWFFQALHSQITADGAYIQHSTNYHRLMLQIALWIYTIEELFPERTLKKLATATQWLLTLVDSESGGVPNLGPNDGAHILPLTTCPFSDFRPTLQSASLSFLGRPAFLAGPWDDMTIWLEHSRSSQVLQNPPHRIALDSPSPISSGPSAHPPHTLHSPDSPSWAYLRAVQFSNRPGHADQLHLDLWWRGVNIAVDAGTFSYNNPPPWKNPLASTSVHNTVTIDGKDQMNRVGRFLWLDWAQAEILSYDPYASTSGNQLIAQHNGYRQIGVLHQRAVTAKQGGQWQIVDQLQPISRSWERKNAAQPRRFAARLHWLLPDWPWSVESDLGNTCLSFLLESPFGIIRLHLMVAAENTHPIPGFQVVRAGKILKGDGFVDPTWGWFSPTYQSRFPALSVGYQVEAFLPVEFTTKWILPDGE